MKRRTGSPCPGPGAIVPLGVALETTSSQLVGSHVESPRHSQTLSRERRPLASGLATAPGAVGDGSDKNVGRLRPLGGCATVIGTRLKIARVKQNYRRPMAAGIASHNGAV